MTFYKTYVLVAKYAKRSNFIIERNITKNWVVREKVGSHSTLQLQEWNLNL